MTEPSPQAVVPSPRDSAPSPRMRSVFAVTALGAFMASLDLSIVNVAFPAMQRSFPAASTPSLSWVITGYGIVFGSLLVVGGRTADRLGRRRTFFAGLAVFVAGSVLSGLAPSVAVLVGGRLLQGAGAAFALPASLGLLLGAFPAERRSQVVALWAGVGALAVATGPSVGAAVVTAGGWQWAFYLNVPVVAVTWLWGRRVLRESVPGAGGRRPDYPGVLLVSGGLAALALAISQGNDWGWTDGRVVAAFTAAALLLVAFVLRSARHAEPVLDLTLFRSRTFCVANAATLVYAMGFFAMLLGNILFLTGVWHYSILEAGLAVTPGPLVVAAVSGPAGRLAGRIGFRAVLMTGGAVFAAGLAWYATRVGLHSAYPTQWLPATLVTGLGIGLTFPVLGAAAVSSLPPERFAVGSSVNQTARQIGGVLGVAIMVALLGNVAAGPAALTAFRHLWVYAGCMALGSATVAVLIGRPHPAAVPSTVSAVATSVPAVTGVPAASGMSAVPADAVAQGNIPLRPGLTLTSGGGDTGPARGR